MVDIRKILLFMHLSLTCLSYVYMHCIRGLNTFYNLFAIVVGVTLFIILGSLLEVNIFSSAHFYGLSLKSIAKAKNL